MTKQWMHDLNVKFILKEEQSIKGFVVDYAKKSPDLKKQVGAVILSEDATICALGFNYLIEGYPEPVDWFNSSWKDMAVVHAEHDALIDLLTYGNYVRKPPYAMIITHTPCEQCSKLLALNEQITHVHIVEHQKKRQNSVDFLEKMKLNVSIGFSV